MKWLPPLPPLACRWPAMHSARLDHGGWIPLRLMYPDADVPVIPLSLQSQGGPAQALRLGQDLAGEQAPTVLGDSPVA